MGLALLAVGIVLGVYQNRERSQNRVSLFDSLIRTTVSPIAGPSGRLYRNLHTFGTIAWQGQAILNENRALKAQMVAVSQYQETVDRLQREVDRFRTLNDLAPSYNRQRVFADVIGLFPNENRITLGAGSKKGVKPGCPVVTADGLLGIVQTVSPGECQALLLNSVGVTVGALAPAHNPPIAGLCRGDAPFASVTFEDPNAPVAMNDLVVTSGFSSRIPRGIPIGRVVQIIDRQETGARKAFINLSASVGTLREVVILL